MDWVDFVFVGDEDVVDSGHEGLTPAHEKRREEESFWGLGAIGLGLYISLGKSQFSSF